MLALLPFLFAVETPVAVVGDWDDRPTTTIAEGYSRHLTPIKAAAEKCGFSRTWIWDDDTSGAQLWVLASEVENKSKRISCLLQWQKGAGRTMNVSWKLTTFDGKR